MNESNNIALYAFDLYGDNILRTAYSYVGNMSEAEDITQDVFLKLHSAPQDFESDSHLKAWLMRVAINKCKNYKKSFRIKNRRDIDDVSESILSYEVTPQDKTVLNAVKKLPSKYSTVIFLYYYEEYTIKEIAKLLDKNENTISSLLQRGRKKLKFELEREGYCEQA